MVIFDRVIHTYDPNFETWTPLGVVDHYEFDPITGLADGEYSREKNGVTRVIGRYQMGKRVGTWPGGLRSGPFVDGSRDRRFEGQTWSPGVSRLLGQVTYVDNVIVVSRCCWPHNEHPDLDIVVRTWKEKDLKGTCNGKKVVLTVLEPEIYTITTRNPRGSTLRWEHYQHTSGTHTIRLKSPPDTSGVLTKAART